MLSHLGKGIIVVFATSPGQAFAYEGSFRLHLEKVVRTRLFEIDETTDQGAFARLDLHSTKARLIETDGYVGSHGLSGRHRVLVAGVGRLSLILRRGSSRDKCRKS